MTELEVFQKSLEVSRATLVVSILLSLVSMVFAILGMAFQRSHNKRSLRPLCDLRLEATGEVYRLGLRNAGLGPLLLGSIDLIPGKGDVAGALSLEEVLKAALSPALRKKFPGLPGPGRILAPGEVVSLVEIPLDQAKAVLSLRKALEGLSLEVDFRDIYGRRFKEVRIL